jgi:hypothetical protein
MSPNRAPALLLALALGCKSSTAPGAILSLSGIVSSSEHGPIALATVVATDSATSAADSTTTDTAGHYAFYDLPSGTQTVSVPALSLPGGCVAPQTTRVAVTAGRATTLPLVTSCLDVGGTYSGFALVTLGGAAAALNSEVVGLGLAPFFPDSVALTIKIYQGDSTFGVDAYYQTPEYQAGLSSDVVHIKGPFVVTPLALQIDTVSFVLPYPLPPFSYTLTISTTCQTSGPQSLAVTGDSSHVAGITGDADYTCTVHLPGIADYVSTLAFHVAVQYTGPLTAPRRLERPGSRP